MTPQTDHIERRSDIYFVYLKPDQEIIKIQIKQINSLLGKIRDKKASISNIKSGIEIIEIDLKYYGVLLRELRQRNEFAAELYTNIMRLRNRLKNLKGYAQGDDYV